MGKVPKPSVPEERRNSQQILIKLHIWILYQKKMFLGSRARPVRKADNLTAICELII
jgi:hypothetical protein